jgi:hypothetical protein
MQSIINRLDNLATISEYVRLYKDFDRIITFKSIGKIPGAVDPSYVNFLTITNGASVLDNGFLGFKNRSIYIDLDKNITDLWRMDPLLTFRFWGCMSDTIGNSFGYINKKNKLGGYYFGHYSMHDFGRVNLVASSFSIFMDKFLSQVEATVSKDKEATDLDSDNDWFMKRDILVENDSEIADFLKDKQNTEYQLVE